MKQIVTEPSLNIGCRYLNVKYLPYCQHSGAIAQQQLLGASAQLQ